MFDFRPLVSIALAFLAGTGHPVQAQGNEPHTVYVCSVFEEVDAAFVDRVLRNVGEGYTNLPRVVDLVGPPEEDSFTLYVVSSENYSRIVQDCLAHAVPNHPSALTYYAHATLGFGVVDEGLRRHFEAAGTPIEATSIRSSLSECRLNNVAIYFHLIDLEVASIQGAVSLMHGEHLWGVGEHDPSRAERLLIPPSEARGRISSERGCN